MNPDIQVGSVEGKGTEITVELGWKPDYVRLWNEDGTAILEWHSGMSAGHAIKTDSSGPAPITSGGISPSEGVPGESGYGFVIGTDAVNTSGKEIYYVAMRSGAGAL